MDKKYIELEAAVETLKRKSLMKFNACYKGYTDAIKDLVDIPTADVQEVRHGRWKRCFVKDAFQGAFHCVNVCSKCGRESLVKEHFCPDCGAKMEGEKE